MFSELLISIFLFVVAVAAMCFFRVGIKILRANPTAYETNRSLSPSVRGAMKGDVASFNNGNRDYRVAAGIALDTKTNTWREQGKLSAEAIDEVFS